MTKTESSISLEAHRPADLRMETECVWRGLDHSHYANWPHEPGVTAADIGDPLLASDCWPGIQTAVWEHDVGLAHLTTGDGTLQVRGAGKTPAAAATIIEAVRAILPARRDSNLAVVPVTFWSAAQHGGRSIRRDIDVAAWEAIAGNYPRCSALDALMHPGFRPGVGGQLLLWHGEPGTGKTTALRTLANEWREWCDMHYIVDPEAFFGHRADYMMDVLTTETQELKFAVPGIPEPVGEPEPRWRLLILEDCGEMLQPDARKEVGQALSRLLNACDGLIGRGLRLLVLVTTNEPVEKLHEAVGRPGRCAARVFFDRFQLDEAEEWLAAHGAASASAPSTPTLADLYGVVEGFSLTRLERKVGFAA